MSVTLPDVEHRPYLTPHKSFIARYTAVLTTCGMSPSIYHLCLLSDDPPHMAHGANSFTTYVHVTMYCYDFGLTSVLNI